jgi:nucleotide-binding universal stress UspA family protein
MGYASIVVVATGAEDDSDAISVACDLAIRHQASVTVVLVSVVPQLATAMASMSVVGARYARQAWRDMASSRERLVDDARAIVAEAARGHGLGEDGSPSIAMAAPADDPWSGLERELPLADLVVVAHSACRGEGPWTGPLGEALMAGRAPVLIAGSRVPMAAAPAAVAWDGSPEAGRAVRAAVSLLCEASGVAILQYSGELHVSAGSAADPARLSRYLKARGVRETNVHQVTGSKPGPALLQAAQGLDAALFVAGAFGHARMAETIFGGATRTFLHADEGLHLFLSH